MRSVGLLVIGDEILAGHTQDTNTHWLAERLRDMGIRLGRVEVCTDDLDDVEASVRRFLCELELDYVITSGGLGPTPDDRTMEGIARALGVRLTTEPEWEAWMRERVTEGYRRGYFESDEPNAGIWKMVKLPEGAEAMPNKIGTALGAIVEDDGTLLFTLPGVPAEFKRMFDECVFPRLEGGEPAHVEELKLYTEESRFYDTLVQLEQDYPELSVGSYPHRGFILIRLSGPEDSVRKAMEKVRGVGAPYLEPPGR